MNLRVDMTSLHIHKFTTGQPLSSSANYSNYMHYQKNVAKKFLSTGNYDYTAVMCIRSAVQVISHFATL